ncbi:hypothetical protein KIN20_028094 [Parelaphostrongylus tenuis]|uniref:Uncharacterized protein n=1 Tax=Parelaphostrongylus tenuis TaxID=148309 RepID=A0AAD5R091_PARTN|nr:hypothetical protein KIN20_028094 [Parelaphostrongylus tenuis]
MTNFPAFLKAAANPLDVSQIVEESRLIAINFHAIYNNESSVAIMREWEKVGIQ